MFREQRNGSAAQKGSSESMAAKKRERNVVLILSIVTLFLMAPVTYSWLSMRGPIYTATFAFKSEDPLWHSGWLIVFNESGYQENLTPIAPYPMSNLTYVRMSWNFTHPENWTIEYFCSGLNRTIGPIAFTTDRSKVLYDDSLGHVIELWIGQYNR